MAEFQKYELAQGAKGKRRKKEKEGLLGWNQQTIIDGSKQGKG